MTWEVKRLGDVCNLKSGTTIPTKFEEKSGSILYVKVGDMNLVDNEIFINSSSRFIDLKNVKQNQIIPKGSVIFPKRGGAIFTNKRRKIIKPTIVDLNIMALVPSELINPDFLYYWFLRIDLKDLNNGSSIPQINNYSFDNTYITYPKSISEQQRIVAILDSAFENIARAKESAEQNLKNANEIFESYLQSVFENKGEGWEEKKLGEVCSLITKGSSPKWQGIEYVEEPGILFITSENVGEYKLILENRKFVEDKFNLKDKKSILQKGDVLTNIVGASIGRTAIYTLDDVANINQAVCILRCKPEFISNFYLMNLLNSQFMKEILHKNEVNNARANLSLTFFSTLSIPLPPISEQQSIVAKLDALSAETKKLEEIYTQKLADLEELKKSILQKAFEGKLTEASA